MNTENDFPRQVESVWQGRRGWYWFEVIDVEEGFAVRALGPAPGFVGIAATATAPTKDEAVALAKEWLQKVGA